MVWRSLAVQLSVCLAIYPIALSCATILPKLGIALESLGRFSGRHERSYMINSSYLTQLGWLLVYIISYGGESSADALLHTRHLAKEARTRVCRENQPNKDYAELYYSSNTKVSFLPDFAVLKI